MIEATIEALADTWETEEGRHGIEAFLSKNPPRWRDEGIKPTGRYATE